MAKMTEKIPSLQALIADGRLEKSLRDIAGSDGTMSFSISLGPTQTAYSFSTSGGDGSSENYSKTVPYVVPDTPSPAPESAALRASKK
jgi:hypothetical protein